MAEQPIHRSPESRSQAWAAYFLPTVIICQKEDSSEPSGSGNLTIGFLGMVGNALELGEKYHGKQGISFGSEINYITDCPSPVIPGTTIMIIFMWVFSSDFR